MAPLLVDLCEVQLRRGEMQVVVVAVADSTQRACLLGDIVRSTEKTVFRPQKYQRQDQNRVVNEPGFQTSPW